MREWRMWAVASALLVACGGEDRPGGADSGSDAGAGGRDGGTADGSAPPDAGIVDDGGDAGGAAPTAASLCAQARETYCEFLRGCGSAPERECDGWPQLDGLELRCDAIEAWESDGLLHVDPVAATECQAALASWCEDAHTRPPPFASACFDVFEGTLGTGETCRATSTRITLWADPCEGYCRRPENACPGACADPLPLGATCSTTEDLRCAPSLVCVEDECVERFDEGAPCTGDQCGEGLVCSGGEEGRCYRPRELGEACTADFECARRGLCVDDRCTLEVEAGAPCREDVNCPAGTFCGRTEDDETRRCRPVTAVGETCDLYTRCEDGSICSAEDGSDVCRAIPIAEGGECSNLSNYCADGLWCRPESEEQAFCRVRGADGEACTGLGGRPATSSDSCASGLFCMADGRCHPPGGEDDPCYVFGRETCRDGLFCARASDTCQPAGTEGAFCNPYVPLRACVDGLYCECNADGCPSGIGSAPNEEDVCASQKPDEEECAVAAECAGGFCVEGTCRDTEPPRPSLEPCVEG